VIRITAQKRTSLNLIMDFEPELVSFKCIFILLQQQ
jgi:hypothetical protein